MQNDNYYVEAQPKPRNGVVHVCAYCGEDAGTGKFCSLCRTQKGREGILEANKLILTELRQKGYCKNDVLLPVA